MAIQPRALLSYFRKVAARSWADRWLFAQVFLLLGIARLALRVLPFRRLAHYLGPLHAETPTDVPRHYLTQAQRVGRAIAQVSPHSPWTSNCFPQALAAKYWLGRRGIPTTLYLGVLLNAAGAEKIVPPMQAHAWLRCGTLIVTGGPGHERFTITARFGGSGDPTA